MEYIAIFIVRWNHDFKYGVNFASAGSGALPETRQGIVIDLKTQLGYFKNVSNQLKQQMGYANSKTLLSKAVYMFSVGSNDYLFPFDTNTTVLNSYTTEQYVGMVIGNITEVIQEIYNIGGRKFGFLNLGLLGCTPNGRVLEGGHSGGCFEKPTPFVKLHNLQLSTLLKGLHTKLKGFKYSLVDFYSFWEERIKHPSKYGFKEAKVACCGSGPYRGHFSCGGRRGEKEYEHEHHGPIIAVIECPNAQSMKSGVRALDDFSCVLGWQQVAAKIGMQRCAASSQWLNERISLSRYAHVPLGNFELDWLIHTADVIFSRALRDQQQVLWISDDGIPDVGGVSEEDTCFADEVHQPVLTYPGAYRKVTVELKIHHLAVDALLKSNQINEMEGGSLLGFESDMNSGAHNSNDHSGFDEGTSCAPAFRVLKQLIQRCLTDAVTSGNVFADAILQHLYRWLCSPHSKLHDPALHRLLHKVMKKVFALLLAEFRKLGASIVFANFSKIIIDTGKPDISAAKAYCDSLLKTLQTRDLFEWIELEPLQFWHSLLFMDQHNYGGIPAKADENVHEESEVDIVSSWNIAENLPKKIQDYFIFIVSQYLYIPWTYAKKQAAIRASAQDGSSSTPSITIAAAENFESHLTEYLKGQISTYFTEKLLGIVRDTVLHMKELSKSEKEASVSAGMPQLSSNAHRGDAALEFIKHVCAVLALDQSVQHNVLIMRKNLLKYVRVREFAPEAEFCDVFSSFILPNVICSYCNDCRDLDLCRDTALLAQEWRCAVPQCGQPYNREVMENSLLQIVRQRERLYHVQDLVCQRCRQVKAAHLAEQCGCAGSYRCKEDVTEFNRKMQIFLNIAIRQKFQLLQECTSWILGIHDVQD